MDLLLVGVKSEHFSVTDDAFAEADRSSKSITVPSMTKLIAAAATAVAKVDDVVPRPVNVA